MFREEIFWIHAQKRRESERRRDGEREGQLRSVSRERERS